MTLTRIERTIRLPGLLVLAGLLIEAVTLAWDRPLAFVLFLGFATLLVGLGVVLFFLALVRGEPGGG